MRYSPPTNPFILLNPKSDISFERPRSAASRFYLHERLKRLLCFVLLSFFFSIVRLSQKPTLDDIRSVYRRIRIFLFFFFFLVSFFFFSFEKRRRRAIVDRLRIFVSLFTNRIKETQSTGKFSYLFRIPAPPVRYLAYLMIRFDSYAWSVRSSNPTYYPTYYPKSQRHTG